MHSIFVLEIMSLGTATSGNCKRVLARLNTRDVMEIPSHSISTGTRKEKKKLCCSDRTVYSPSLLFACEYGRYLLCPSANIVLINISCALVALILSGMMFSVLTGEPSKRRSFTFDLCRHLLEEKKEHMTFDFRKINLWV